MEQEQPTRYYYISEIEGEPRVFDLDLAKALKFKNPNMIRKLINRHKDTLSDLGTVISTVEKTSDRGGRPGKAYYLNEKQTAYICTKSETPKAIELTIAIIKVFTAWRKGHLSSTPAIPKNYSEALRLAADQAEQLEEALPKAAVADRIANSIGLMCITDTGKTLGMQPRAFRKWLTEQGYIYQRQGNHNWVAYQQFIQQGLFEHKTHTVVGAHDGVERTYSQALVTPKGLARFAAKLNIELNDVA